MMFSKAVNYVTGIILLSLSAATVAVASVEMPPPQNGDLVSVPEPSSLILMGVGLIALGFMRRRK